MNDALIQERAERRERRYYEVVNWARPLLLELADVLSKNDLNVRVTQDALIVEGFGVWECEPANAKLVLRIDMHQSAKG